jgi:hypothetical protein
MKIEFSKLFNELKSIQFECNIYDYEIESKAIIQVLRSVICRCITIENASKETIDEWFKNALDFSIELDTSRMGDKEKSIYTMIRDHHKMKHILCYQKTDPALTIEQQTAFRDCVRELYPKITEAAQTIKERIEMPPTEMPAPQTERVAKKQVKWADRFPSTKSSSSSLAL